METALYKDQTINGYYMTAKRKGLVYMPRPSGELFWRTSPGAGPVAKLILRYDDLSFRDGYCGSYAYAATMIFDPAASKRSYEAIVKHAIAQFGRTQLASNYGALLMFHQPGGILIHKDEDLLADLSSVLTGDIVWRDLTDGVGKFQTLRQSDARHASWCEAYDEAIQIAFDHEIPSQLPDNLVPLQESLVSEIARTTCRQVPHDVHPSRRVAV